MVIQDESHHYDVCGMRSGRGLPGGSSTHLHVLETILRANDTQHILFTAFLHFASEEQLVEDEVCFLKVEDDVELANISVVLVHLLHVAVNDFQRD